MARACPHYQIATQVVGSNLGGWGEELGPGHVEGSPGGAEPGLKQPPNPSGHLPRK